MPKPGARYHEAIVAVVHRLLAGSLYGLAALSVVGGGCSFPDPRIGAVECERDSDCDFMVAGKPCERAVCDTERRCVAERRPRETPCDAGFCLEGVCLECFEEPHCQDDGGSDICIDATCVPTHCDDDIVSDGETDLNCGGPDCAACPAGKACLVGDDCLSGACDGATFLCVACDGSICHGGFYCEGEACVPLRANGQDCTAPTQCASSLCNPDAGKCCNEPCDGLCMACDGASTGESDGECRPVRRGIDPYDDCSDLLAPNCDGKGGCLGIGL